MSEFLNKLYGQRVQQEISLVKKRSAAPLVSIKSCKESNYLNIRNNIIEHLYSHKVVAGSEFQDDDAARREDEEFLDSFLPKPDPRSSQLSVSSSRSRQLSSSRSKSKSPSSKSRDKISRNESSESPQLTEKRISLTESDILHKKPELVHKSSSGEKKSSNE